MADEPNPGTPAPEGGEHAGTPGADDGKTGSSVETQEQKIARLEAAHKQSLAEKSNLERVNRENEELRARLASQTQPPTTGGGAQPNTPQGFIAHKQEQIRELEAYIAQYPNDVVARATLTDAQLGLALVTERVQQSQQSERTARVNKDIDSESQADEIKRRAKELYEQGYVADAKSALLMARGEAAEAAEQKRRDSDAIATARLAAKPSTSGGSSGGGETRDQKVTMTVAEYNRRVNAGERQLIRMSERGAITFTG